MAHNSQEKNNQQNNKQEQNNQQIKAVSDSKTLTQHPLQVLIVSGRSGSGKTSVINILEDFGYYAIDNLPLSLVPDAVDKLVQESHINRIALGIDVRTPRADLSNFAQIHENLQQTYGNDAIKVLYVTAQQNILVARFDATRRVHPLMAQSSSINNDFVGNLPTAIEKEVELLEPIASHADIKIDTSGLNIHQLKERIRDHLGMDNQVVVNLLSFGFKYGIPIDADYIFDVRILPNPHWKPELRAKTGQDKEVAQFFAEYAEVDEMGQDITNFVGRWLPEFLYNNRHTVTIAIGCTGGKHRSVFITEMLSNNLKKQLPDGLKVVTKHREKRRW